MGSSRSRYDISPVTQGAINQDGRATSILTIVRRTDHFVGVIIDRIDTDEFYIRFTEYPSGGTFRINGNTTVPQNIDVCMTNTYYSCAALIRKVIDVNTGSEIPLERIQFESAVTPCYTYPYRLGSDVIDITQQVYDTATPGFKCRISVGDWRPSAVKETNCCTSSHLPLNTLNLNQTLSSLYQSFVNMSQTHSGTCPIIYSNGYTTTHCNTLMNKHCIDSTNNTECIMYMLAQLSQTRPTLEPFINYCSENLHSSVCMYMALEARNKNIGGIPDQVLRNYCGNNPSDKSCTCYNAFNKLPDSFKDNMYIGPLACWYKPCAELTEPQFLLTSQVEQRKGCNLTKCSIDIGNININSENPSLIKLINDCNYSSTAADLPENDQSTFFEGVMWNTGRLGIIKYSLVCLMLFIPMIVKLS